MERSTEEGGMPLHKLRLERDEEPANAARLTIVFETYCDNLMSSTQYVLHLAKSQQE